jgi:hypothetical protein
MLTKNGLGNNLGDFFTNSSGHPVLCTPAASARSRRIFSRSDLFPGKFSKSFFIVRSRVARGFFQTKNTNMGKCWRASERKMLVHVMTIWNILLPFGILYGRFGRVCDHLVHFSQFGMFGPRKIWQPRCAQKKAAFKSSPAASLNVERCQTKLLSYEGRFINNQQSVFNFS